jgi:excisionase family DNA binding protein
MSVTEFLRWAGIGRTTFYAQVRAGKIRLRKLGAKSLIARADAEAWLAALPSTSAT